jgi:hypothetical protein
VAGLQMIPLVLGIMAGAMSSGIAISKTGKYKVFPLVGTVLIVVALVAFWAIIEPDTSVWSLVPFMVLMGLGLGFNFQPVILAVQNAVSPREMGVATSSVTFFRQMGGTIGVAAFLSVLFTTLTTNVRDAYAAARGTAEFQQAAAAHHDQVQALQGLGSGNSDAFGDTSFVQQLDAALVAPFKEGLTTSIGTVFLVAAVVVAVGFVVLLFLPQVPLRNQSGIQARAAEQGPDAVPPAVERTPDEEAAFSAGSAAPTSTPPPAGKPRE